MTLVVDHFSALHDQPGVLPPTGRWSELIPLSTPAPGEQYGFEVDLDACSGCKACVSACHHLNGLNDDESWRRTGLLVGTTSPWRQTITSACHHCLEPACLQGCPVNAYEKDPVTGIVRHLDDQCIGCSYCTLTCPYEVPRYDSSRGIVRKCDLCHDRLAEGEAPACVQACPTEAISVTLVDVVALRAETSRSDAVLVPAAPASALTLPTTRYHSRRPIPLDVRPADDAQVNPAHEHMPLAVMLVLTQLSVGATLADWLAFSSGRAAATDGSEATGAIAALAMGLLALAASVAHLGRPMLAWKAVIGLRRSWLSREIVAFGVYAGAATVHAGLRLAGAEGPAVTLSGLLAVTAGVVGVACSVLLYAVTGRRWWATGWSGARFAATTAACGAAVAWATDLLVRTDSRPALVGVVAAGCAISLLADGIVMRHRDAGPTDELGRTAHLLAGPLRSLATLRVLLSSGGLALVIASLVVLAAQAGATTSESTPTATPTAIALAVGGTLLLTAGELLARRLFFLAVAPPRLPGELR